ncbi:MAG TPA: hypothetical protein EYP78_00965 [Candidatus Omnitrophica bacterium]|nr:hypothetical protein [Candidatus Omnitrophota bacterium]
MRRFCHFCQSLVRIEENGEKFYRRVADISEEGNVKESFTFLADEEVKHRETFEEMLPEIEKYEPPEAYPPEYFAYLRAYADNIIFKAGIDKELPENMDAISAVDFGIHRELDSIAYYYEAKKFVPEVERSLIDKIIEEERRHFVELSELKEKLQKGD